MRNPRLLIVTIILMGFLLAACSSGTPTPTATSVPPTSTELVPTATADQPTAITQQSTATVAATTTPGQESAVEEVAEQQNTAGKKVYDADCSGCHGADLQGVTAPALTPPMLSVFGDAEGLLNFISSQMPQGSAGSLSSEQYQEVTAYLLHQAGFLPASQALKAESAASIALKAQGQSPAATPAGTPAPQEVIRVKAAEVPTLGTFLTDNKGFTLYVYSEDKPGISNCIDGCASIFPPLTVPSDVQPTAAPGIPGKLGVIQRPDGTYQVTYTNLPAYNDTPLYNYYGDTEAGETSGEGYQDQWEIISVTGITTSTTSTTTATTSAPSQGNAALGAAIYLEDCTPCHGNQGEGVDAPALRDSPFIKAAGDQAVFNTIANGRTNTEMPAWLQSNGGPLTDAQIADVVAFLHTLQDVQPLPTATPEAEEPTETPLPPGAPTPEPAKPSEPGGPGAAASMTGDIASGQPLFGQYCASCHGPQGVQGIPNPGSDDGSVPPLYPIDPTIANPNAKIFAGNVDLFIQHGSIPEGPGPLLLMPAFGDKNMLSQQQIADIIAYVMSLNGVK